MLFCLGYLSTFRWWLLVYFILMDIVNKLDQLLEKKYYLNASTSNTIISFNLGYILKNHHTLIFLNVNIYLNKKWPKTTCIIVTCINRNGRAFVWGVGSLTLLFLFSDSTSLFAEKKEENKFTTARRVSFKLIIEIVLCPLARFTPHSEDSF